MIAFLKNLIALIQKFLLENPEGESSIPAEVPTGEEPLWIQIAKKEIGVKEITGGETKRIIEYHATTTLKASEDEIPWCSSFMNWVMIQSGYSGTNSAAARSWLAFGRKSMTFKKYSIVVFKRGNNGWSGHVAFAMADLGGTIRCLGGNQSNSVNYSNYNKSDVLGYMWPTEAELVSRLS